MYNREGFWDDGVLRECTKCSILFEKTSKTVSICPGCNTERVKSASPEWRMHQRAKQRAAKKGLEFSITPEDITIPAICPILDIPLAITTGKSGAFTTSPSLDRIDNTKGYTPDNIQVISQLANQMKGSATRDELIKFAIWVLEVHENESN